MRRMLAGLLLVTLPAWARPDTGLELDCANLQKVVAQAPDGFESLVGKPLQHITSGQSPSPSETQAQRLLGEFSRETWAATALFGGARRCNVVRIEVGGPSSRMLQWRHACHYPAVGRVPASLNQAIATCIRGEPDPDADATSLVIVIDEIHSGEGFARTAVAASASTDDGLWLSVDRTTCLARAAGGCDDDGGPGDD